jgi:hypothetical protein
MSRTTLVARPWWVLHWLGIVLTSVACLPSSLGLVMGLTHPPIDFLSLVMNAVIAGITGSFGFRWARLMARFDDQWLVLRGLFHSYRIRRAGIAAIMRLDELQIAPDTASSTVKRLVLVNSEGKPLAVIPNSFDTLRGHEEIRRQLADDIAAKRQPATQ